MDAEAEKSTFSAFERFLYWFFIPIVFTMVLIGALLSLFDYDVMSHLQKAANKIPGISALVPDPKDETKALAAKPAGNTAAGGSQSDLEAAVADLKKQLEEKETELKAADTAYQQKDQALKDTQAKLAATEEQSKSKGKTDDEYGAVIKETAAMYAKMAPGKAAPIMENLTLNEQVLLFSLMKPDDRVEILEKMNPKKAAEASILLKDSTPVRDRQIAALQERVKQNETEQKSASGNLTKDDLGKTFSSMSPDNAADLLIEMDKTNPAKVTEILNSMDVQGRSKVMSSIAKKSKETAASMTAKLAP